MKNVLLICLLLTSPDIRAQTNATEPDDAVTNKPNFEVGLFMDAHRKLNLTLGVHRPKQVRIVLKNADNKVLYWTYLKRSRTSYWQKFDFEGAKSGVYALEISDDRQTLVRRIEVVDIPAIASQRYIIFGPQPRF